MGFPPGHQRKKYPSKCSTCDGTITERIVNLTYPDRNESIRLVEGAPAGACDQCPEKYLTPETAGAIERLFTQLPARTQVVPVWEYSKRV